MGETRRLNRLAITGILTENTPLCVIFEVARAHNISYNESITTPIAVRALINDIHSASAPEISNLEDNKQWGKVARFVNDNVVWDGRTLVEAYNFLMGWIRDPMNIPSSIIVGQQTPECVTSLNACVLYRICRKNGIYVDQNTTLQHMGYLVGLLNDSTDTLSKRVQLLIRERSNKSILINMLAVSKYEIDCPESTDLDVDIHVVPKCLHNHDALTSMRSSFDNISILQKNITPTRDLGAIALAAMNYSIDISLAANPLLEYQLIRMCNGENYTPSDSWLKHWYIKNPLMFNLRKSFNPLFAKEYYNMHSLALEHGMNSANSNISLLYECFQIAYVEPTFYIGEYPLMVGRVTLIDSEDIDEIEDGMLLSYGQPDTPMHPVTFDELAHMLTSNCNFIDPFNEGSMFRKTAISKLEALCTKSYGAVKSYVSDTVKQSRMRLLNKIKWVHDINSINDDTTKKFVHFYNKTAYKTGIQNILLRILHLGMYMRGWDGKGAYPLENTTVPDNQYGFVAVRVTEAFSYYFDAESIYGDIAIMINNLPLLKYVNNEIIISTDRANGLTIGERIRIAHRGTDNPDIQSCIRITSNWLCYSVYRYITLIGLPAPFELESLRWIS